MVDQDVEDGNDCDEQSITEKIEVKDGEIHGYSQGEPRLRIPPGGRVKQRGHATPGIRRMRIDDGGMATRSR
jgi:hypothetical protein